MFPGRCDPRSGDSEILGEHWRCSCGLYDRVPRYQTGLRFQNDVPRSGGDTQYRLVFVETGGGSTQCPAQIH